MSEIELAHVLVMVLEKIKTNLPDFFLILFGNSLGKSRVTKEVLDKRVQVIISKARLFLMAATTATFLK